MRLAKHFILIFLMAFSMSYYLYSYTPRDYNLVALISMFIYNIAVWFLIFGIPYLVIALLYFFVKRQFSK